MEYQDHPLWGPEYIVEDDRGRLLRARGLGKSINCFPAYDMAVAAINTQ